MLKPNSGGMADPKAHDLRAALQAHHGITPEKHHRGEGIDGLLSYIVRPSWCADATRSDV